METIDKKTIASIFSTLQKHNQNARSELNYTNNFTLLVAVILSAQATDMQVNKVTEKLFPHIQTPEALLAFGEERLRSCISRLNYYNTKAKHLIQMAQKLIADFNSEVPNTFDELISLSGVGRKTANVVLNVAFEKPTIPVDTHVLRVSQRLGLSDQSTPEAVEKDLLTCTPQQYRHEAHHLLLLFGRYTCKARNPECQTCILKKLCRYVQSSTSLV